MKDDPTGCQYITKEISLENAATSIKILLAGHVHADADIRAFYSIGDKTGFQPIFTPFPGFDNINNRGQVINAANNNTETISNGSRYSFINKRPISFTVSSIGSPPLSTHLVFKITKT